MEATEDSDEARRRPRWPFYLTLMMILPLVYALSVGPVLVIAVRCGVHLPYWQAAYMPLFLSSEAVRGDEALEAYMNWWLHITNTDTIEVL